MTDSPEKKRKKNVTDFLLGVGLALLVYLSGSVAWYQYTAFQSYAPATNWVEVTKFQIPYFKQGVNPVIDYQRTIKQTVSSSWTSEIRRLNEDDSYTIICTNSGFSELDPGREAPPAGWTVGSFAGNDCVSELEPGLYRLHVVWELRPRGFDRTIRYPFSSNAFQVEPAS